MDTQETRDDPSESYTASERYFCPFPGCKRSFAELWRLKVHYRAPPDIRGSGKERGHGTELTHCPKCGKGLKPGKHHVGCSAGKTGPRQAKRQRSAANPSMVPSDGVNGDAQGMYGMGLPNAYAAGMPNGGMPNGYSQFNPAYGQQQYPVYPQQQQYQPDVPGAYYQGQPNPMPGGMMQPQMAQPQPQQPSNFHSPTLGMEPISAAGNGPQLMHAGSGDMLQSQQQYQYQQQPPQMSMQQQPMMQMQQPQQHDMMQQQPVQQQPLQQHGMDMMGSHMQQQPMMMPQIKQEVTPVQPGGHVTTASGAYMAQQQQQQQQQAAQYPGPCEQGYVGGQQAAQAVGLMPPPPPVPMLQMPQQPPTSTGSASAQLQQHMLTSAAPPPAAAVQASQITSNLFEEIDNMGAGAPTASAASGDAGSTRAPSPPPLPPDFPSSVAAHNFTLFNFSQFNQKLPAQQGPSQQMAMMPTGMQRELPPSMDDLWAPEATYDHHSDGDLMQLLFGAPEQPPTMATIHLHHFLEDDACSSPLLGGLLGGSMDDLRAAEAKAGGAAAPAGAAVVAEAASAGTGEAQLDLDPVHPAKADSFAVAASGANGFMLPPSAVPGNTEQLQEQQRNMAPLVKTESVVVKQHTGLAPGNNGVIAAAQCGSSAVVHMQMHTETVQIKAEDGSCMLQKTAVASLSEAVASRAT